MNIYDWHLTISQLAKDRVLEDCCDYVFVFLFIVFVKKTITIKASYIVFKN